MVFAERWDGSAIALVTASPQFFKKLNTLAILSAQFSVLSTFTLSPLLSPEHSHLPELKLCPHKTLTPPLLRQPRGTTVYFLSLWM